MVKQNANPKSQEIQRLVRSLANGTPTVRRNAARKLGQMGAEAKDAVDALVSLALSGDETDRDLVAMRQAAWKAAESIVDVRRELVPKLITALGSSEDDTRRQAVRRLRGLGAGATKALDSLWTHLRRSESPEDWELFWKAISKIGGVDSVERLVREAEAPDVENGIEHLADQLKVKDFELLIANGKREAPLRFLLGRLRNGPVGDRESAVRHLGVLAKSSGDGERGESGATLPEHLQRRILTALSNARDDEDPTVRSLAMEAFRDLDLARLLHPLSDILKHRDDDVVFAQEDQLVAVINEAGSAEIPELWRLIAPAWARWIAYRDRPHLVEQVAAALNHNSSAIAPLVNEYRRGLERDDRLKCRILLDNIRESLPSLHAMIRRTHDDAEPELSHWMSEGGVERALELMTGHYVTGDGPLDELLEWLQSRRHMSQEFALELVAFEETLTARSDGIDAGKATQHVRKLVTLFVDRRISYRETLVRRRITEELAEMASWRQDDSSEPNERQARRHKRVLAELNRHALPLCAGQIQRERDVDLRRNMARVLGNLHSSQAVDALTEAVVGEERTAMRRQQLLDEYYLKPSRERSREAAEILKGAVEEAKTTLRLLRVLNTAVFIVGVVAVSMGLALVMLKEGAAAQISGGLASIGGLGGLIAYFIREPMNRVQNSMSNLVQLEAAFTSFIWELNLNSTYIQSQYVAKGELSDADIAQTVDRIEDAMGLALSLVQAYTTEGGQRLVSRITSVFPASDRPGAMVTVYGQHLQGDSVQKKTRTGMIAINHKPVHAEGLAWKESEVRFRLPEVLPGVEPGDEMVWISLFVDGMETNALPFHLVSGAGGGKKTLTPVPAAVSGPDRQGASPAG